MRAGVSDGNSEFVTLLITGWIKKSINRLEKMKIKANR